MIKCWLYKICVLYIGKCNKMWDKQNIEVKSLNKLTYKNGNRAYLKYGMDAEWKNFSRYYVLDNAIQRLNEYENNK